MEYNDVHKDLDKTCRSIKSQPHIVELKEESEGNSKLATQLIKLMLYSNPFHYTRKLEMNTWSQLKAFLVHIIARSEYMQYSEDGSTFKTAYVIDNRLRTWRNPR